MSPSYLDPLLLGVLLQFREHPVGIIRDMQGIFHQVCLLPEDKSLLLFVCLDRFEWQVMQWKLQPAVPKMADLPAPCPL